MSDDKAEEYFRKGLWQAAKDIYDQLLCSDERDEQISNERLISRIQGRIESCMHLKDYDSVARDCYHLIMLLEDTRSMSNPDYSCSKDVTSDDVASYKIYLRLLYVLYEQHKYMEAYDILQKLPTNLNNYADTKPRVEDLTRLLEMNLENDQTKLSKIASTTTYTQFKSILAELENLSISDNNSIPNSLDIVRNQLKDPIDTDCSFYNIIRSNDIEQLDKYYVKCTENKIAPNDLEEMLSQDYEDLKLKNVPLSKDMEIFVEEKLINHRFFTNQSQFNKNATDFKSNVRARIELLSCNLSLLQTYRDISNQIDGKFLFAAKTVAQNIHILKRQLRSSYNCLPWEEIEFCLVAFILSHVQILEINLFYNATLNTQKILQYLEIFIEKLKEKQTDWENTTPDNLSLLPKIKRAKVITNIVSKCPEFADLYKDYQQIRDVHSLRKVSKYIKLALSVNPNEKEGQLIIMRVLQVIGEFLKNTLESPKLSDVTSDFLSISLPKNTRAVVIDLRNSLSHGHSLAQRVEIETCKDVAFFLAIQNDVKKIDNVVTELLYRLQLKTVENVLQIIANCQSEQDIRESTSKLRNVALDRFVTTDFIMTEHEKLRAIVKDLRNVISHNTKEIQALFGKLDIAIENAEFPGKNNENNYLSMVAILKAFHGSVKEDKIDEKFLRDVKFRANYNLEIKQHRIKSNAYQSIGYLADAIYSVIKITERDNPSIIEKVRSMIHEIYNIILLETGHIRSITDLCEKLTKDVIYDKPQSARKLNYNSEMHLASKLMELKDIINKNTLSLTENMSHYMNDNRLQAILEMLVLDIMSILDCSKPYLENNLLFLDENTPLLIGKSLRNHLAHDNSLIEILPFNPATAVILNANKLVEGDITKNRRKIGKLVKNDANRIREKYENDLRTITMQEMLFLALEEGNLPKARQYVENGADIKGRNIAMWTALHFAAKGHSLETIRFVMEHGVDLEAKDVDGRTALHVAAEHGNREIVIFLIERNRSHVNVRNARGKTALHLAVHNGHKDIVEVLLDNDADLAIRDNGDLTPLYSAIINNHVEIAKLLFRNTEPGNMKDGVLGEFSPLHVSAEHGSLEFSLFLLEHKANVNAKNYRNYTPLHAAAINGHLDIIDTLIQYGAEVNARVINGCTALYFAVEYGHKEIVAVLLKNGAFIDVPETIEERSPLYAAAQFGHIEITKMLLDNGANIYSRTSVGATPLHSAAHSGHSQIVEELIKRGAEIDSKTKYRLTPLHVAAEKGKNIVVGILIANKADTGIKSSTGTTPLHAAAQYGSIETMEILLTNEADVNAKDFDERTPLMLAAYNGHTEAVAFLIKHGASTDANSINCMTALHAAILGTHKDIVNLLISHGARVNVKSVDNFTPLLAAIQSGNEEIVGMLLAKGANINEKIEGITPMQFAIRHNHKRIVEILLEKGIHIRKDHEPLFGAVCLGHNDIVELLLKNKAHVDAKHPKENVTPLHLAATVGRPDTVKILLQHGASVDGLRGASCTPLYSAAEMGHSKVVEILIASGANVNVRNIDGPPLHIAAGKGHMKVVEILLNNGANADSKDNHGRTALELAASHGYLSIVKCLMQYKHFNLNDRGNDGFTVLHIASQEGKLETVKYLVNSGSDMYATNNFGSKPVHVAAREGYKDVVEFFIEQGMDINEPGNNNQTILHYSILNNNVAIAQYLIQKGANINAKDTCGLTPVHLACCLNHEDVLKCLLQNGACYNPIMKGNNLPLDMTRSRRLSDILTNTEKLFLCAKRDLENDVESCIEQGAIVQAKNVQGQTSLHYAAMKGQCKIVKVLLQLGADPNAVNDQRMTALHYASKLSHVKIAISLLSCGAIYNSIDSDNKTPKDYAANSVILQIFDLVSRSFKRVEGNNSRILEEIKNIKNSETLNALLNARDNAGDTLLISAVKNKFAKMEELKLLVQGNIAADTERALELLNEGKFDKALHIYTTIYNNMKRILGSDSPCTMDVQTHIASALYAKGSYREALSILEQIFERQTEIFGSEKRETLSTRSFMAFMMHIVGRNEEALHIYREVLQKQAQILGRQHLETLESQLHMALVLNDLSMYEEALLNNETVFKAYKQLYGVNNPSTIRAQNNIGMVLSNQGKFEEALKIYEAVLKKKQTIFGLHHNDTLRTLSNIAGVLYNLKRYPESLEKYHEVLSLQRKFLGANHPNTLLTEYNLGNVLYSQKKLNEALAGWQKCFDKMKYTFGSTHSSVLDMQMKMEKIDKIRQMQIDPHILNNVLTNQQMILDKSDVNVKDKFGRTALHYAVSKHDVTAVSDLLKGGADVTLATDKGNTPLHTAANTGSEKITDMLLRTVSSEQLSAFINAQTTAAGTTSLHIAAKNGFEGVTRTLLKRGAIYNPKNNERKTPLDLCNDQEIRNLLQLTAEVFDKVCKGQMEIIHNLQSMDQADVEIITCARNDKGHTILQTALVNKHRTLATAIMHLQKTLSQ